MMAIVLQRMQFVRFFHNLFITEISLLVHEIMCISLLKTTATTVAQSIGAPIGNRKVVSSMSTLGITLCLCVFQKNI